MHTHTAVRTDQFRPFVPVPRDPPPPTSHVLDGASEREPLAQTMHLMGAVMSFPRNAEIFGENEPAEYLYKVISGSVRTYKILSDGRRQIGGFHLPGDIFGFQFTEEAPFRPRPSPMPRCWSSSAVRSRHWPAAMPTLPGRGALTSRELRRMQDRVLLLIKSGQERVASFLLEMADRAAAGNVVELPMSRQDIADYLGLTIETVSRTLTCLESTAAIEVPSSRRIVLRNRSALNRLNG